MEGEEYSYKWTVVNFPQNLPPGTVEVNNEKIMTLSQLSPGNYTFQVIVNSMTSFGEAIVNVTVLARKSISTHLFIFKYIYIDAFLGIPAKHLNKPPVAIIRPTSQTVHLPNNVSILDGSSSTDDTKIVSYQWDLEKGPISYRKFSPSNSETLQLKGDHSRVEQRTINAVLLDFLKLFTHLWMALTPSRSGTGELHFQIDSNRWRSRIELGLCNIRSGQRNGLPAHSQCRRSSHRLSSSKHIDFKWKPK